MSRLLIILSVISLATIKSLSQNVTVKYDYISSSTLYDNNDNSRGEGDISIISGNFNLPLSFKLNQEKQPIIWTASVNSKYAILNNNIDASLYNPDKILNTSVNITHIRPVNSRWSFLATLGVGVYAHPDNIRWNSLLANGGFCFIYTLNENLRLGVGGGLTNSYGAPIIIPMIYLKWQTKGKYELNIDFAGRLKISAATQISPKSKLELVAIEMDGISAVVDVNNDSKIYSSTMFKSYLSGDYSLNKHFRLFAGIGVDWRRTANLRDRSLKNMFDFNNEGDKHFAPAFRLNAGIKYQF